MDVLTNFSVVRRATTQRRARASVIFASPLTAPTASFSQAVGITESPPFGVNRSSMFLIHWVVSATTLVMRGCLLESACLVIMVDARDLAALKPTPLLEVVPVRHNSAAKTNNHCTSTPNHRPLISVGFIAAAGTR